MALSKAICFKLQSFFATISQSSPIIWGNRHSYIFQVVPPMQDEPVPMYIGLALV